MEIQFKHLVSQQVYMTKPLSKKQNKEILWTPNLGELSWLVMFLAK
jgi:hypothetical protein